MALLRYALGDPSATACQRCDICQKENPSRYPMQQMLYNGSLVRPVPIPATRIHRISDGISLLDGKLHTPLFLRFMQERKVTEEIDPELLALLLKHASTFEVGAVAPLPSRTWKAQGLYAKAVADHLNVPLLTELLSWQTVPEKRQGELLNNDQRHHNVHEKMQVHVPSTLPNGALLLLDDYIGSGSTIKEAARALRKVIDVPLIPLTIAAVKWRLGKPGFI